MLSQHVHDNGFQTERDAHISRTFSKKSADSDDGNISLHQNPLTVMGKRAIMKLPRSLSESKRVRLKSRLRRECREDVSSAKCRAFGYVLAISVSNQTNFTCSCTCLALAGLMFAKV
ncbi:hypothetical protein BaRGS_00028065 [Batillaria attramentaria]|uniref:Uncharacterized protein n=1 Tax=Batillaria attramentaria TaxID=370345 RepID=A0ABD0K060_9CAEN